MHPSNRTNRAGHEIQMPDFFNISTSGRIFAQRIGDIPKYYRWRLVKVWRSNTSKAVARGKGATIQWVAYTYGVRSERRRGYPKGIWMKEGCMNSIQYQYKMRKRGEWVQKVYHFADMLCVCSLKLKKLSFSFDICSGRTAVVARLLLHPPHHLLQHPLQLAKVLRIHHRPSPGTTQTNWIKATTQSSHSVNLKASSILSENFPAFA